MYRKLPDGLEWISLNSMGKIAKGAKKIYFTMLYGNYCYIFVENFPQKFSPCTPLLILHFLHVPEVLNVHVNEIKKKIYYSSTIFIFKQWKINFWERKCDFLNTLSNVNLFHLIVINFFVNFLDMNPQNFRYIFFAWDSK